MRAVAGTAVERNLPSVNGQSMLAPKAGIGSVLSAVVSGSAAGGGRGYGGPQSRR
jgi:hypothetical protein